MKTLILIVILVLTALSCTEEIPLDCTDTSVKAPKDPARNGVTVSDCVAKSSRSSSNYRNIDVSCAFQNNLDEPQYIGYSSITLLGKDDVILASLYVKDPTQAFLPGSSLRAGRQFVIRKNIATLVTRIYVKLKHQRTKKFEAKDNSVMCEIRE